MKIEKINDNQIRCTLTREDLETRHLRLSELAYGSDKTKKLFHDMMLQAQAQFGFEADNMPLMIEAIPLSSESVLLIITKVEDPEELDTRFSKFSPFKNTDIGELLHLDGADNIIDLFKKLCEAKGKPIERKNTPTKELAGAPVEPSGTSAEPAVDLVQLFRFPTLDDAIVGARSLKNFFEGQNALYKDLAKQDYCLVLHQSNYAPEDFNKICNVLSEYGFSQGFSNAGEAYFTEHGNVILGQNAIAQLASL